MNSAAAPIPFLRLPLTVDRSGLLEDLAHCLDSEWRPHFNSRDYEGGWDSIALRSQDGQVTTVFAHPDRPYQDTPLLAQCPHFQDILANLRCEKESVRLLRQAAGGEIKTHRDIGLGYADGVFRLHIPLVTNDEVEFVVAGHRLPMRPGECWFADFSQPHSVHNRGQIARIHLVIDCIRNAWTDEWFEQAGFAMESLLPPPMSEATRQQMLLALREMDNPAAAALIQQLEAEAAAEHITRQRLVQDSPAASRGLMTDSGLLHVRTILDFLDEIGIPWKKGAVPEDTFLPGMEVVEGCIVIDEERLQFPGDILHEAGHIALVTPEKRPLFSGNVAEALPEHKGDEVAVILWTYAVCLHLGLPLDVVIHDSGYHQNADWLRDEFQSGNYIGLPLLVWMGLCEDPKKAKLEGREGFPRMVKWIR